MKYESGAKYMIDDSGWPVYCGSCDKPFEKDCKDSMKECSRCGKLTHDDCLVMDGDWFCGKCIEETRP
jgi:hypothetical protein